MSSTRSNLQTVSRYFYIDRMTRYSVFVPRLDSL
jgi:hypothetical protein